VSHKPVTTEELAAAEHAAQQIRDHGRDRGVSAVVLSELAARIARDLATEHATSARHNAWRNQLARLMLDMSAEQVWNAAEGSLAGRPFVELIHFSDCEGFMGPKTCAKLSADFVNNQKRADAADEYFRAKYADWRKAFAIASDGGAVDFH